MNTDLAQHAWWLASRASGIIALALVTISVGLGLTMAGRFARKPGLPRILTAIHEQTALTALVAIGVHGATLLGDPWLNPGPSGIAVPFTMSYRPLVDGPRDRRRVPRRPSRAHLLHPPTDRATAVAAGPPVDDRRLRAGGRPYPGGGHRCVHALDARLALRNGSGDRGPVRRPDGWSTAQDEARQDGRASCRGPARPERHAPPAGACGCRLGPAISEDTA